MSKRLRSFSAEFKSEAVNLLVNQGHSIGDASRSLSLGETAVLRWVAQLGDERSGITPKSKALTPAQRKSRKIEARINRLGREKAILRGLELS